MSVGLSCSNCGRVHVIPPGRQGMHFHCKKCGFLNEIPSEPEEQTSAYALAPHPLPTFVHPPIEEDSRVKDRKPTAAPKFHVLNFAKVVSFPSQLERESLWLVLLSMADLLLTYALLRRGAHFYESNPVAQWFFARWNIAGMTMFKFGLVGSIIIMGEIIESRRPGWGRAILGLGCAAAGCVVVYSIKLLTAAEA